MTSYRAAQAEKPAPWARVGFFDAIPIEDRDEYARATFDRSVDYRFTEEIDAWCLGFPAGPAMRFAERSRWL